MAHRPGYSDEYRARHEQAQRDEEAALRQREQANEGIRKERRAALDAQKRAVQRERETAIDAALAPRMATIEREWRIAHPGRDFEQVRPLVREQLLEEDAAATREGAKRELLATGKYSL